ncbi:MAG: hypothetical protein WD904_06125 [Dehalococcoidia bacterium]
MFGPTQRIVGTNLDVSLARREPAQRGTVDVVSLVLCPGGVAGRWQSLVERGEARNLVVRERCFGDDEDVDVAGSGVVATEGERAAEVGAE